MPSIVFSQSNSAGSGYATNTKYVRISYSEVYDIAANRSTVTLTNVELMSPATLGNVPFFGKVAFNGSVVADFEGYGSTVTASADSYCPVNSSQSYGSILVQHDAETGAAAMSVELRGADSGYQNWFAALYSGGKLFGIRTSVSQNVALATHPRASTILSCPRSVETLGELSLDVSRNSPAFWHKASFSDGSRTLLTSEAFETTLSLSVPRSWFSHDDSRTLLELTVSVQTYTDASCSAAVGSPATLQLSVKADEGMRPKLQPGWVTISPYNEGAASAISGYVEGFSRAQAVFDRGCISLADTAGATLVSLTVRCQGSVFSEEPYRTGVLAARELTLVCTATDSRGRSASESFSLDVMDYEKPALSGVEVFRCDAAGTAAEDGLYYSVRAAMSCSALNGQNSATLTAAHAAAGGAYGAEQTLASGTARVIGTIQADASYTVRIRAQDSLGSEAVYFAAIPTRRWAMKFRPDGRGVAFGKAAETDNCLELAAGWGLRIGGESIFSRIYPVGSIYLSVVSTSPATLFGGSWERIENRFLLAAGSAYAPLTTGGAASHTLTVDEIPAHNHGFGYNDGPSAGTVESSYLASWGNSTRPKGSVAGQGGGAAFSILPPYLAVYAWKRTA